MPRRRMSIRVIQKWSLSSRHQTISILRSLASLIHQSSDMAGAEEVVIVPGVMACLSPTPYLATSPQVVRCRSGLRHAGLDVAQLGYKITVQLGLFTAPLLLSLVLRRKPWTRSSWLAAVVIHLVCQYSLVETDGSQAIDEV